MIDKTKNHIYLITVHYLHKNGIGEIKTKQIEFTSNHGMSSKRFKTFLKQRMQMVKGYRGLDKGEGMHQYTVPLENFCN